VALGRPAGDGDFTAGYRQEGGRERTAHDVEFTAARHFLPVRSILVPLSSLLVPAIYFHVVGPAVSSSFTTHHSFTLSGHHCPLLPFSFSFFPSALS
jgi:hypothetical protein